MTSLQDIIGSNVWHLIASAALALSLLQLAALILTVRQGRSFKIILPAVLHFLVGFCVAILLISGVWMRFWPEEGLKDYAVFHRWFLSIPWCFCALCEVVFAILLFLQIRSQRRYRETHLRPDAVRETVDLLPAAICISDPDGTVRLANLRVNELCRELTGKMLSNAGSFWQDLGRRSEDSGGIISGAAGGETGRAADGAASGETGREADGAAGRQCLVRTDDDQVWMFSKERLTADGKEFDQIIGTDMTVQYRVTEELSQMNKRLRDVQIRMKTVSAREHGLIRSREIVQARTAVHNQMGNVLLTGRYYMDHPEAVEEEELLRLLIYNNHFLIGEAEQLDDMPDAFHEAVSVARRIGVTVQVEGTLPGKGIVRDLTAQAAEQCVTNTARHAEGDLLTVSVSTEGTRYRISFTNNGKAPEGPIRETGGLASLRRTVEAAGGTMTVQSAPAFRLELELDAENPPIRG